MPKQKQNRLQQKKGISTKNNNTGGRQTILSFANKSTKNTTKNEHTSTLSTDKGKKPLYSSVVKGVEPLGTVLKSSTMPSPTLPLPITPAVMDAVTNTQ